MLMSLEGFILYVKFLYCKVIKLREKKEENTNFKCNIGHTKMP